jgi:hypothetical protein
MKKNSPNGMRKPLLKKARSYCAKVYSHNEKTNHRIRNKKPVLE